jgi:hypothetical protein
MANVEIVDGTGDGQKRAKVNKNNRLEAFSITERRMADISIREGRSFIITSDFVALTTTGSFNGMLYVKNTDASTNLFVDKVRVCGTGTSMNSMQCKFFKNPTAGTLISDANDGIIVPANLGSNEAFGGTVYAASGDGKTVTDGTQFSQFTIHLPGHTIQEYDGALIIPGGSSLAIAVQPGAATTACVEVQCWIEDKK